MAVLLGRALRVTAAQVDAFTSPALQRATAADYQHYTCLEALLRARVPAGALVVNDGDLSAPPRKSGHGVDYQRIAEELTPGYRVAPGPVPGAYRVRLRTPGPCGHQDVQVTRVPGP